MIITMLGITVQVLIGIMNFIEYLLIAYIILGWFVFFGAIKNRDSFFFKVYVFLMSRMEPVLARIRQFLPSVMGFDFSPLVIFLGLHFAKIIVSRLFLAIVYG